MAKQMLVLAWIAKQMDGTEGPVCVVWHNKPTPKIVKEAIAYAESREKTLYVFPANQENPEGKGRVLISRGVPSNIADFREEDNTKEKINTAARPQKIKAVKFVITRAEGPTHGCGVPCEGKTWADANSILLGWRQTAPKEGHGYHKCDFVISFADGQTYHGRYDLTYEEVPNIAKQVASALAFYAGVKRPHHMDEETYQKVIGNDPALRELSKRWLETYQIGDVN